MIILNEKRPIKSTDELYKLISIDSNISGVKIFEDLNAMHILFELNNRKNRGESGVVFHRCCQFEGGLMNLSDLGFSNPYLTNVKSDGLENINWRFENDDGFIMNFLCEKIYVIGV